MLPIDGGGELLPWNASNEETLLAPRRDQNAFKVCAKITTMHPDAEAAQNLGFWNGENSNDPITREHAAIMAYRSYRQAAGTSPHGDPRVPVRNEMKMIAYSQGELLPTSGGGSRTGYAGKVGAWGVYHRFMSYESWKPPYFWTGEFAIHGFVDPPVFINGNPAHYNPGIVFHPLFVHDGLNTLIRFNSPGQKKFSLSAETPTSGYGVLNGYHQRTREDNIDLINTGWHSFEVQVQSALEYSLYIDGELKAHAQENDPGSMGPSSEFKVGLRLDFFDVEFRNMNVV